MGNASGREEDGGCLSATDDDYGRDNAPTKDMTPGNASASVESMGNNSPQGSPPRSPSPHMFAPQLPVAPLRPEDDPPFSNPIWRSESESNGEDDSHPDQGIPTLITWNQGGKNVSVEGSWDNWASKRVLQRAGKDHFLLLVLPPGIFHYRFIVDEQSRYMLDLPSVSDESGNVCNVLDVHDYVPDSVGSISEFENPPSPESSYAHDFPGEDDCTKDPMMVPPQLHLSVLGTPKVEEFDSSLRPQHVVLNHLYIEKGRVSQSVVGLGLTHRFESKYVTVVLYKPLRR